MKQNNKNEKRKRKLRIAAGKRKERLEYRENTALALHKMMNGAITT